MIDCHLGKKRLQVKSIKEMMINILMRKMRMMKANLEEAVAEVEVASVVEAEEDNKVEVDIMIRKAKI